MQPDSLWPIGPAQIVKILQLPAMEHCSARSNRREKQTCRWPSCLQRPSGRSCNPRKFARFQPSPPLESELNKHKRAANTTCQQSRDSENWGLLGTTQSSLAQLLSIFVLTTRRASLFNTKSHLQRPLQALWNSWAAFDAIVSDVKMRWKVYIGVGVIQAPMLLNCAAVRIEV